MKGITVRTKWEGNVFQQYQNAFSKIDMKCIPLKNEMEYGHILGRLFLVWDSQYKLLFKSSYYIYKPSVFEQLLEINFFENTTTFWPMWETGITS